MKLVLPQAVALAVPAMAAPRRGVIWALLGVAVLLLVVIVIAHGLRFAGNAGGRVSLLRRVPDPVPLSRRLRMCRSFEAQYDRMPEANVMSDWGDCFVATAVVLRQSVQPMTSQPHDMVFLATLAQVHLLLDLGRARMSHPLNCRS